MVDRQRSPPQQQPLPLSPPPNMHVAHLHHPQMQPLRGPPPPPAATDLPVTLTSLAVLLRDVEYLTARYGSTTAACARLDELERGHMELQTQLATLQQKLNMAMVAAAAAQVDHASSGGGSANGTRAQLGQAPTLFDADALLGFLQHHCACRGDLALLQPVLGDFQRSLVLPTDARFPARDVLLSVHEIVDVGPQTQQHTQPVFIHMNGSTATNSMPPMGQSPVRHDSSRSKKRHPDVTRLTPKEKAPGHGSPARSNDSASSTPRLIAPAGGRAQAVDRRARQEEKQAATMLSALSRPTTSSATATTNNRAHATTSGAAAKSTDRGGAKIAAAPATTSTRRSQNDANAANLVAVVPPTTVAAAATQQQKKRASSRPPENVVNVVNGAPPGPTRPLVGGASVAATSATAEDADGAVNTRKRTTTMAAAASHEVVVKQNLSLPHDKRNIVELKQSSQHLTLENLEELNRLAPWDEVYRLRATFSHVLDYTTLDEAARKWFVGALRVQFVWRREFWERLHWLPMSEAVCSGAGWERYRQTRKRRANKAIAAWRKVYGDSLELMRQRLLPEDVWCDVALWYMPSTPLYWLPNSPDLMGELTIVDTKHPVRCYFVQDFRKHPFYNDDDIQRKYPRKYDLPTPQMLALQNEDKESRVNIAPE